MLGYFWVILILVLCFIYNIFISTSEAKVKYLPRRNKSIDGIIDKGYKISKRWDCNAISIFIDENRKDLGFLVMAWRKDTIHHISINDIENIEIETVGIIKKSKIKKLLTQVCLNIETVQGKYVLRTLYVKGIGIKANSKEAIYAKNCAEEIYEVVRKLKK